MDGSINFAGTLSGGINTGGGSEVTITPTLQSGEKIADYSIDNVPGVLYAPDSVSLTAELPLSISENVISIDLSGYATVSALGDYQEKLTAGNYINIDSNNQISCTPPITNVWYTPEPGVQQDVLIGKFTVNEVTQNVYAPSGGSSWNYSTSEVNTGQKWIDGKDIYCRVLDLGRDITFNSGWSTLSIPHSNIIDTLIKSFGVNSGGICESIGLACNDTTYFEVKCYTSSIIRYITYFYTKN